MVATMDFWTIFVVYTFGNFWAAVVGLAVLFFIILLLGRVSMYTIIFFTLMFFVCMAMGYGYGLVTIPITLFILVRFIYDLSYFMRGKD